MNNEKELKRKKEELKMRVSGNSMEDGTSKSICNNDEILVRIWEKPYNELPIKEKLFVIETQEGQNLKQITEVNTAKELLTVHSFNPNYKDAKIAFNDVLALYEVECKVKADIIF